MVHVNWIPSVIFVCCSLTTCCLTLHFDWPWLIQRVGIQLCWISSENPLWMFFGEHPFSCFQNKEAHAASRTVLCLLQVAVKRMFLVMAAILNEEAYRFPLYTYCLVTQAPNRAHNSMFLAIRSCRMPFYLVTGQVGTWSELLRIHNGNRVACCKWKMVSYGKSKKEKPFMEVWTTY